MKTNLHEKTYVDKQRLSGGFSFNEALARAICESVCLIVVFSPTYLDSPYCADELLAMEEIEEQRKHVLGSRSNSKDDYSGYS